MVGQVVRGVGRLSAGVALGVVPGALYAALVGAVHLGVYGRWDRIGAFAVGCVLVGAVFGLLGGIVWALSGAAARERRPVRSTAGLLGSHAAPRTEKRGAWSSTGSSLLSPCR